MRAAYTSGMTQIAVAARRESARERTGQFGEQLHSAPEVSLALGSISDEEIDSAEQRRRARSAIELEAAQFLRAVESRVDWFAERRDKWSDRDDIIGDAVLSAMETRHRDLGTELTSGFANYMAGTTASQYIGPCVHHTSRRSRAELDSWFDAFLQEHSRFPTEVELAEKADEIRLAAPAGKRPVIGYENLPAIKSLDDGGDYDSYGFAAESGSDYATDISRAASANDALEDDRNSFRAADARKCIWNLLSEDGPQVAVKTIDDDRAHRAAVDAAGGPLAVARAWESGDIAEDDPATVALFAPFGTRLTEKDREAAADVLTRNAGYAEKVWDSAMTAALDVQRLRSIKRREARHAAAQAESDLTAA